MSWFPPIAVRQPQPYDIVDDPVGVCSIGTGFEGQFIALVRDARGGDTLSGIAQKYYNDASRWPVIYEANRYQIQDPDRIFAGQVLRIPQ